jgi:hypothetical protein
MKTKHDILVLAILLMAAIFIFAGCGGGAGGGGYTLNQVSYAGEDSADFRYVLTITGASSGYKAYTALSGDSYVLVRKKLDLDTGVFSGVEKSSGTVSGTSGGTITLKHSTGPVTNVTVSGGDLISVPSDVPQDGGGANLTPPTSTLAAVPVTSLEGTWGTTGTVSATLIYYGDDYIFTQTSPASVKTKGTVEVYDTYFVFTPTHVWGVSWENVNPVYYPAETWTYTRTGLIEIKASCAQAPYNGTQVTATKDLY